MERECKPGLPLSEAKQPIEPYNWFYCAPPYKQTSASDQMVNYGVNGSANDVFNNTEKKQFLVFDKSGDQTSLIYSSVIRTIPLGCLNSWNNNPKPRSSFFDAIKEDPLVFSSFQNLKGNNNNNQEEEYTENVVDHENTDELNALLYSDDEYDYPDNDDDVTSTGHSPSTMIEHEVEDDEEVGSSVCSIKRRKLFDDGSYDMGPFKSSKLKEDDAESYCSNFDDSYVSLSGKKRSSRIRNKLSILQNIIPGVIKRNKKNPTVVIDEAVHYLKFLKEKAMSFRF